MSVEVLRRLMDELPEYRELTRALSGESARLEAQLLPSAAPFTLAALRRNLAAPALIVAPRPDDARRLRDQIAAWCGSQEAALHFPESEILPFERLDSDAETLHERIRTLAALAAHYDGNPDDGGARNPQSPPLVVASVSALMQRTLPQSALSAASHKIERGQNLDLADALDLWRRMGYQFESAVYAPGFVSRRGGILDIFPIGADMPARIELWGSEIDSIRLFDPATQRSADVVNAINVPPAHEILPALADSAELERIIASVDISNCDPKTQARVRSELDLLMEGQEVEEQGFYAGFFNRGGLLDYFAPDALLIAYKPDEIADAAWELQERAHQLRETKEARGELPLNFPSSHLTWREVEAQFASFGRRLDIDAAPQAVSPWDSELNGSSPHNAPPASRAAAPLELPLLPAPDYFGNLERFAEDVWEMSAEGGAMVVAITNHSRRLAEIFAEAGIDAALADELPEPPAPGSIMLMQSAAGGVSDGFVLPLSDRRLALFSDAEIFGVAKQRRTRRRSSAPNRDAFLSELSPGDYVVHIEHGIGKFNGVARGVNGDNDDREYLFIEYASSDKLYVPLEHLDRVTPYVAPMSRPPSLTRLGTQEWRRAKQRAERSTREMASELLALYAARELVDGHSFVPDAQWQAELEESFPFEETPDQRATIADVKADMESVKPMDRLVCGDVGYGKTEIALRAAFKAVMDGKQVAVLVPTTVLAQQHYATFSQRLSAFPTRVEVLSRFRTQQEQRDVVERLKRGEVDICIGTHRLIQKDVEFKDLGLLVVDEEQRFGVAHKERLKRLREEVDVLTLTATPIPRSLHMALAGVRDMSAIETPPEERLPIKTYVSEFSDALIREAILREIDRQGQVYFLHNRVYNINYIANYLSKLAPEARFGVAHGQMPEGELEDVMLDFAEGAMDVLVCTTIIESGLDIPNVNTLIINRADTLGLSQLYQLRGRVGRSARRAYCYLLVPQSASLTEPAEKRLRTMLDANELGAGFRIAMKDLEIRGAGNILGAEQSGNIHAVGFDLYTRLLSNAVEELRARRESAGAGDGNDDAQTTPAANGAAPAETAAAAASTGPILDIGIPASIPDDYIADLPARLAMYQRVIMLKAPSEVADVEDELRDRFGPLPWQARNLLYLARLRLYAKSAGVQSLTREGERIVLRFGAQIGGARPALQRQLGGGAEIGNTQIRLPMSALAPDWERGLEQVLERLAAFAERMLAAGGGSGG